MKVKRTAYPKNGLVIIVSVALMAAPFLALLYSPAAGLTMMAMALGAAVFLLLEVREAAPLRLQRPLRLVVGIDVALSAACALAAIWWVVVR